MAAALLAGGLAAGVSSTHGMMDCALALGPPPATSRLPVIRLSSKENPETLDRQGAGAPRDERGIEKTP
jgi:hypothetical protein